MLIIAHNFINDIQFIAKNDRFASHDINMSPGAAEITLVLDICALKTLRDLGRVSRNLLIAMLFLSYTLSCTLS